MRSFTVKDSLFCEADEDFINCIEVSLFDFDTLGMPYNRPSKKNDARAGLETPLDPSQQGVVTFERKRKHD